ncbi:MAG: hypothetical protein JSU92_06670 [Deltaproteobacteria bacterium]|nr:MAG: hypothetical protein JSU92_06670 [Deltaproteobacteria bacterium]
MKVKNWYRIVLIGIVFSLGALLWKEAAAQGGRTIEERLAYLEAKLSELEGRLSRLEGPRAEREPKRARAPKNPISITILNKTFVRPDPATGNDGRIDFIFDFSSNLQKDIAFFRGILVVEDPHDTKLLESELSIEDTIKSGVLLGWRGSISLGYDPSLDTHHTLATIDKGQLRARIVLKDVVYTDGTRETFE